MVALVRRRRFPQGLIRDLILAKKLHLDKMQSLIAPLPAAGSLSVLAARQDMPLIDTAMPISTTVASSRRPR